MNRSSSGTNKCQIMILMALLLFGEAAGTESPVAPPLQMGILPYLSTEQIFRLFTPMKNYLEQRLGRQIVMTTAPDFRTYVARAAHLDYDIYQTAPHFALLAEQESGYRRVARMTRNLDAAIFVRKDDPARRVEDLRGRRVASPNKLALTSILGEQILRGHGMEAGRGYELQEALSHNNALMRVAENDADAAFTSMVVLEHMPPAQRDRLRVLLAAPQLPQLMIIKLVLASTAVEIVMLGVLVWNSTRIADEAISRSFEKRAEMLAPLLNASIAPALAQRDFATLDDLLEKIVQRETIVYIEVRDALNRAVSAQGPVPPGDALDVSARRGDGIFDQVLDVKLGGSRIGHIRFGVNVSLLDVTVDQLRWQGLSIAALEVILTFLFLTLLGYLLTRHLRMLSDAARNMEQGDYEIMLPVGGSDEVADTAHAFNTMARAVESSLGTLKKNQALLKAIIDNSSAVIYLKDLDGRFMLVNREFERLFGLDAAQIVGKSNHELLSKDVADAVRANDITVIEQNIALQFEEMVPLRDGPHNYLSVKFPLQDETGQVVATGGISTDITERKHSEHWREGQNQILKLIISDAGLSVVLDALVRVIESEHEGAIGSVLLLDADGVRLRHGAGPDLPTAFMQALDGTEIGPAAGSCGTAAYERRVVIAEDVQTDPRWANYRELAGRYGLRACWSQPIFSAQGAVLGTFAMYYRTPRLPTEYELHILRDAESLATLAIESARTRAELVASEQRFRATFEQAAVGMAQISPDGRWLRVNQRLCDITGYGREELLARSFHDITHPDDLPIDIDNMRRLLAGYIPAYVREKRYLRKDGTPVWINLTASLVRTRTGAPDYFISVIEDIRARKQAVDALKDSERFFRNVLDGLPVMAGTLTPQGVLIFANRSALMAGGLSSEEVIGKPLVDSYWISWSQSAQLRMSDAIGRAAAGEIVRYEDQVRMAGGQKRNVEIAIVPLRDTQGCVTQLITSGFDITESKRTAAEIHTLNTELEQRVLERTTQLAAANKELEAFAYSVSHDLRSPLRAIDGFSQVLIDDYAPHLDAVGQTYLERVRAATQRMGVLIDDLLLLSRVSRQDMVRKDVDLSALAQDVVVELMRNAAQRTVTWIVAPGLHAQGDARLLRVMLDNLLSNAWKYTSKKPAASIEFGVTEHPGGHVYFVRDNGAGFDMQYADKLFGAFQRMHKAEEFPGTGVGLATVARVIHRHGGRIWAQAEVGQGAIFFFTLAP
ncbi:MAG: PAS domain S-box protein [Gammaproteobacteria bacterium]|nr:PAS domain S-box protein [Gammaproteobacteria bacterium]